MDRDGLRTRVMELEARLVEAKSLVVILRERCEERAAEILELREQSERPKCAYCDFGEREKVTLDLLRWHIEKECVEHPLYQALQKAGQDRGDGAM